MSDQDFSGQAPPGAELEGASPAPKNEPEPGTPRWNEVYRNWKEEARRAEELDRRLKDYEMRETFSPMTPSPAPTPAPQQQQQSADEMEWFWEKQRNLMRETVEPLQQRLAKAEAAQRTQAIITQFEAQHPDYQRDRDQELLVAAMKRYGVNNLEAGYRLAFPERVIQQPPPVSDVRGTTAHVPADSPQALLDRFNDPRTSISERNEIASRLADMGGWGAARAEKALGF